MPTEIRCPSCQRTLRVPDNLMGRTVRCPDCRQTFTATAEDEPTPPPQRPARPRLSGDEITEEPARPARRPQPPPEYEEVDEDYYEEEEDERPRRRRRSKAGAVIGPAIGLLATAFLSFAGELVDLVYRIVNTKTGAFVGGPPQQSSAFTAGMFMGGGFDVLSMLVSVFILLGAIQMMRLRSYELARATTILAIVPLHCCCMLGIPFGIWGLVALNDRKVRKAFSRNR
jgi:predicted Zn finger-like uncharacterized protein